MPLKIIRDNITNVKADAIVNPTDPIYSGSGGADYMIHQAAGPELDKVCLELEELNVGEVVLTPGFNLPAKYIIHTVGPVWNENQEQLCEMLLDSCYKNALELAEEKGMTSVAFPLISSGTFGFPKEKVLKLALSSVCEFLIEHQMTVYIVVYDASSYSISKKITDDVEEYISDNYCQLRFFIPETDDVEEFISANYCRFRSSIPETVDSDEDELKGFGGEICAPEYCSALKTENETFPLMLLRLIREKGMTNAECYKKALVNKSHFSRIINNPDYNVGKTTVVAFVMALELSADEADEFLNKAGYALSDAKKFDVIVKYFLETKNYDIYEANEVLYEHELPLLGYV